MVRALDDAVEASLPFYPHPLSAKVMTAKRKIGVGVCGLADLLLQAGLPYDSKEGRDLARDVIAFVNYASKLASADLAASRGPCPAVGGGGLSRFADPAFLARFAGLGTRTVADAQWAALASRVAETGMLRNSSTVALPPTGRSAPVIGASTGIEPLFLLTDPHQPGFLHPAARSVLARAGHEDMIGEVSSNGRLPDSTPVSGGIRDLLAVATQIPASATSQWSAPSRHAWTRPSRRPSTFPPPRRRLTSTMCSRRHGERDARASRSTGTAPVPASRGTVTSDGGGD